MNAAVLHTIGKPPRFEPFLDPDPGEDEVIVHVHAAARSLWTSSWPAARTIPARANYRSRGADGVDRLDTGMRVFFGGPRRPYGAMAERTVVRRAQCFPVPDGLEDDIAAAIPNPGMSAWLSLKHRARLVPGETVLVLGATGVTGKLAVQVARILGGGRVVAAGRK